jgi:hypothetical protein
MADVRGPMVDNSELAREAIFSRLRQHHQRLDLLTRSPTGEGRAAGAPLRSPLEKDSPMAAADAVLAIEAPPPGCADPDPAASAAHAA